MGSNHTIPTELVGFHLKDAQTGDRVAKTNWNISKQDHDQIDEIADEWGVERSEMLRILLHAGINSFALPVFGNEYGETGGDESSVDRAIEQIIVTALDDGPRSEAELSEAVNQAVMARLSDVMSTLVESQVVSHEFGTGYKLGDN